MEGAMADLTSDAQAAFERWWAQSDISPTTTPQVAAWDGFLAGRASVVDASAEHAAKLAKAGYEIWQQPGFPGVELLAAAKSLGLGLRLRIVVDATTKEPS
jgi:hypothetical protein